MGSVGSLKIALKLTYQHSASTHFVETVTKGVELLRNGLVEDVVDVQVHVLASEINKIHVHVLYTVLTTI